MPDELTRKLRLEIGHVLFLVGYSKLLISEQSEQLQKLKKIVRRTEQFRSAKAEGKLLRLPAISAVGRGAPKAKWGMRGALKRNLTQTPQVEILR